MFCVLLFVWSYVATGCFVCVLIMETERNELEIEYASAQYPILLIYEQMLVNKKRSQSFVYQNKHMHSLCISERKNKNTTQNPRA